MNEIDFGVCRLALVPVRSSPSHTSAQITQLLFGDHYHVLDECAGEWLFIKPYFDGVEGWIDKLQHHSISRDYFDQINNSDYKITTEVSASVLYRKNPISIVMGSVVPVSASELFKIEEQFAFNGEAKPLGQRRDFEFVRSIATKYLHAPYMIGGKSPFGIDAFAFVQMVYKIAGYTLPRFEWPMPGKSVENFNEALPGDLLYCTGVNGGPVNHVAMLLENGKVMHCHGRVRLDQMADGAIVSSETKIISHVIASVRRIM